MKAILIFFLSLLILLTLPLEALGEGEACMKNKQGSDRTTALQLKLIAIASILAAGATGVLIPILGRCVSALRPEKDIFFIIKAFAAGVILATGLIHILPDAFERLTSQCLEKEPWHTFPFAGFVAMCSAMGTMMVDSCATSYYKRSHFSKALPVDEGSEEGDGERGGQHVNHVDMHTHGAHGHAHGELAPPAPSEAGLAERIRHRVISQVLELGIVVHSVIIGVSLGASERPSTIRPLVGALSFHQFFEGIGLGGCLVQANFRARSTVIMAVFFSLTTPLGIAVGIGISSSYDENSSTALIVEGILNAASAGILIYMALVDLLADDFMNPRMQGNGWLQLGAHMALLLGVGFMSLLAKWA